DSGAWQVEPEGAHPRKPAAGLAHVGGDLLRDLERSPQVDVERDERPARSDDHGAGGRVETRGAEVRAELATLKPALQFGGTAGAVEGGAAFRRRVDEHRQPELADSFGEDEGGVPRALDVVGVDRDEGDDIGGADARMRSVVPAEVDALARDADGSKQPLEQLVLTADDGEHRAVVIGVRVHVEQPCMYGERRADCVDRRAVTTFGEVRHRLERQHPPYSMTVLEYYERRATEYDDWYLGAGL